MVPVLLVAACVLARAGATPALPRSTLSVIRERAAQPWWRSECAAERWPGELTSVADAVQWQPADEGVERGELRLAGSAPAWRVRVMLVRIDPKSVRFQLMRTTSWNVDSATSNSAVAVNAGQFEPYGPWGWVVMNGRERLLPKSGPLAPAIVIDDRGAVHIVPADSIAVVRRGYNVIEAFQSYPQLLTKDGDVPPALRQRGRGVDLEHRDARLAFGTLRDGRVLIALTRYDALGKGLQQIPLGPTAPEMAAIMGALGCNRAVMLDGGLSGQMMVRDKDGSAIAWRGLRDVPLGLVAIRRSLQ